MVDVRHGHRIYHWKHGWIPLDHTAALSKAKGNHGLASHYLAQSHQQGHAHASFANGKGTGGGSHMPGSSGFQPVAHEHLPRQHNVTVAYKPGTKAHLIDNAEKMYGTGSRQHQDAIKRFGGQGSFHVLDTKSGDVANLNEDTASKLQEHQLSIHTVNQSAKTLGVTDLRTGAQRTVKFDGSDIAPTSERDEHSAALAEMEKGAKLARKNLGVRRGTINGKRITVTHDPHSRSTAYVVNGHLTRDRETALDHIKGVTPPEQPKVETPARPKLSPHDAALSKLENDTRALAQRKQMNQFGQARINGHDVQVRHDLARGKTTHFIVDDKAHTDRAEALAHIEGNGGIYADAEHVMKPFERIPEADNVPEKHLQATSLYFSTGKGFQNNCVLASATYELRRRGYDVLPVKANAGRSAEHAQPYWFTGAGSDLTSPPDLMKITRDAAGNRVGKFAKISKHIEDTYPAGSRGTIRATWMTGSGRASRAGHIFNWEVGDDGKVSFYDPQPGKVIDGQSSYWERMYGGSVMVQRLDDKPFTANVTAFLQTPKQVEKAKQVMTDTADLRAKATAARDESSKLYTAYQQERTQESLREWMASNLAAREAEGKLAAVLKSAARPVAVLPPDQNTPTATPGAGA